MILEILSLLFCPNSLDLSATFVSPKLYVFPWLVLLSSHSFRKLQKDEERESVVEQKRNRLQLEQVVTHILKPLLRHYPQHTLAALLSVSPLSSMPRPDGISLVQVLPPSSLSAAWFYSTYGRYSL